MFITDYIKKSPELMELYNRHKNKTFSDIVAHTELFKFDDIIDDDNYGPNTKVIYVNGDKEDPWPIADIISRTEEEVPAERLDTWKQYMSQYNFEDVTYNNLRESSLRMKNLLK